MVNFFKKYWIAIIIVIALIIVGIYLFRRYRQSISFDFSIQENLDTILNSIIGARSSDRGAGIYIDIPLTTTVKNKNAAAIVLENIAGSISYNGQSIMQTNPNSPVLREVSVAGKSSASITDNVQVLVNENTIKFFTDLVQGKKPAIKYNFSTNLFGQPKNFTNSSTISPVAGPSGQRIASDILVSRPISGVATNVCSKGSVDCVYRGLSVPCRECTKRGIIIVA